MRKWVLLAFGLLAGFSLRFSLADPREPGPTSRKPDPTALGASIAELPEGFSEKVVATGITGATAMAIAPDGRIFVCEQTGALRVIKDDTLLKEPFVTVPVDSSWERGLIGVALGPDFPKRPFVYLCYVAPKPYPHHRVSRFTAEGDVAAPDRELILLEGDDQTKLGGVVPNGHQGGAIHFGKDGKLYIAIGDQTAGLPAQKLDTFQGKLLRIDPDGSIPEDNPFFKTARGKYRTIWALGLRNPFTFAVQPGTGRIFINDVGEARWEEINEGVAGANFGWPHTEGPATSSKYHNPVHAYDHSVGRSIAGATFYNPPIQQFPKEYVGKFFFADFMDNWIRVLDPDHPKEVKRFATGLVGPVDLQVGPDGSLYYLNRNAWVKDAKFKPNTGSLHRISYTSRSRKPSPVLTAQPEEVTTRAGRRVTLSVTAKGEAPLHYQWYRNGQPVSSAREPTFTLTVTSADDGAEFRCLVWNAHGAIKSRPAALWTTPLPKPLDTLRVGLNPRDLPRLLSETGIFRSLRDLTPVTGILPYDVNTPLWSDGAAKRRWIALPRETRIGFSERGAWKFPPGTVFVKHFEMPTGKGRSPRRLETRLLVVDRRGSGYGVTYRWRADGSDAELLTDGLTEQIERGDRKQLWSYPSRNDCLVCHTTSAGFVLGVNTRQLNHPLSDRDTRATVNRLQAWNRLKLFQPALREEDIPRLDRLVALTDSSAALEHRVRSYLDANCAQCHRPGGTRGDFDARFNTPLAQQKLVNAPLLSSDLGVSGVKLVAPGAPDRSMVYLRMKRRQDVFNMPPLASHETDPGAVAVVRDWIENLAPDARADPRDDASPWGIASGAEWSGDYPKFNPLLRKAGVGWLRLFPEWQVLQPKKDEWNWKASDKLVADARTNKIHLVAIWAYLAPWASADGGTRKFPIKDLRYWREYITGTVERYHQDVKYWEVWNEFNGSFGDSKDKVQDYARLVRTAYDAAKKVDPTVKVGLSVANFDVGFLDAVIKAGAADHFDFICVHPYENLSAVAEGGERGYLSLAGNLRKMLAANKQKTDMPLWITEIGYQVPIKPEPRGDAEQAEMLAKAYLLSLVQGFERIFWFEARGPSYGHGTDHGIIRPDWTLRPAYDAFKTMTTLLGPEPRYLGWLDVDKGGYGFLFKGQKGNVLAAWSPAGKKHKARFAAAVSVTDLAGKRSALPAGQELVLSQHPVFLSELPADLVRQAQAQVAKPFPWGGNYTNAEVVTCRLAANNTEDGLKQVNPKTTVVENDRVESSRRPDFANPALKNEGRYVYFRVDPQFVPFGTRELEITLVAKRLSSGKEAGVGLCYESAKGYTGVKGWWKIPKDDKWHENTWKVSDANFVGQWGWNFRFDANGSPNEFLIKEVRVKKPEPKKP